MADYAVLANVRTRLDVKPADTSKDAFISTLITRASAIVDNYTDNHFTKITATRKFDLPRNPRRLLLDDWLITCTSVTNGNGIVIPNTEYDLEDYNDPPYYAIVLHRATAYFFMPDNQYNERKVIAVAGDWGWSTAAPDDIIEVTERLVVQMYRSRDGLNMTGASIITPAGVVQTPRTLPRDVTDILDNYRKTVLSTGSLY